EEEMQVRESAHLTSRVPEYAKGLVRDVMTNSIDGAIRQFILAHDAYPSPMHYTGFPRPCCTICRIVNMLFLPFFVNWRLESSRLLEDGNPSSTTTTRLHGYSEPSSGGRPPVEATKPALEAGIGACGPGHPFWDVGQAIHDLIQHTPGYSVHGIGEVFHRPPCTYHTLFTTDQVRTMLPSHCFTIEFCIVQRSNPCVWIFPDG
ncbi:peptidase M24, structural domain-containing protein, partial [Pisolithus sp. B1]